MHRLVHVVGYDQTPLFSIPLLFSDTASILQLPAHSLRIYAGVTLNTAISCKPSDCDTDVPEPVFPLYSSVHLKLLEPSPGTSLKLIDSVAAPSAATRPTTTPSESGPAQYLYSFPDCGPDWPFGVNVVAALPRESWWVARMP